MIRRVAIGLALRALAIVASGAMLIPSSELWFYPVNTDAAFAELLLAYGLIGWMCLSLALTRAGAAPVIFAGALIGLLVEGVLVQELYSALPFTILWTSLAWHMVLSVWVGIWLYRKVMLAPRWGPRAALCAGYGAALGLWGAYMWTAETDTTGAASYAPYLVQCLWAYAAFLFGHLLWDRVALPLSKARLGWDQLVLGLLTLVSFATQSLWLAFPYSLALPLCVLPLVWLAVRLPASRNVTLTDRIPVPRHAVSLLIPATAVPTYEMMRQPQLLFETNALAVVVLGGAALWLLAKSVLQSRRTRVSGA